MVSASSETITTPALIIQAREDDLSSLKNAEYLQRHLGGLVGTIVLDDSYHIVTVDRQRDLLIESTMAFATMLAVRLQLEALSGETVLPMSAPQVAKARPAPAADAPLPDAAGGERLP